MVASTKRLKRVEERPTYSHIEPRHHLPLHHPVDQQQVALAAGLLNACSAAESSVEQGARRQRLMGTRLAQCIEHRLHGPLNTETHHQQLASLEIRQLIERQEGVQSLSPLHDTHLFQPRCGRVPLLTNLG